VVKVKKINLTAERAKNTVFNFLPPPLLHICSGVVRGWGENPRAALA